MIPYLAQPEITFGPIAIHAFGVLVAGAVLVGLRILRRRAKEQGLPDREVTRFANWVLLGGFVGAHLIDRLVYFPRETWADPVSIFRFWEGLSSFGGFLGGTLGGLLFLRLRAVSGTAWKYADSFAYAFPSAWILGRTGCFVAFDHPGRPTHFILGEVYRDGIVRHNLGLEEALYTIVIALVFRLLAGRRRFAGFYVGLFLVLYAPFRFAVDFLRIVDVRYSGLTPGQWGCIILFTGALLGVGWRRHILIRPGLPTEPHSRYRIAVTDCSSCGTVEENLGE